MGRSIPLDDADMKRPVTLPKPMRRSRGAWALFWLSLGLAGLNLAEEARTDWAFDFVESASVSTLPEFRTFFLMKPATGIAHAPSIAVGPGIVRILWFEGSREAMPDVTIEFRDFDLAGLLEVAGGTLLSPQSATSGMSPGQPVVILGNTVQGRDGNLGDYFATVVSAGGWAAASVAHTTTTGEGGLTLARKLPLSPLINRSYLVRSSAVAFADGDIGMPVYHELLGAFGEFLRIGPDGRVKSAARIGAGKLAIQPEIVITGHQSAVAFLRPWDSSAKLLRSETTDGGRSWTEPQHLSVENPNAPVSVVMLSDGRFLMAGNPDAETAARMSLLVSEDKGLNWRSIHILEDGKGTKQAARYPDMRRLPDGRVILVSRSMGNEV